VHDRPHIEPDGSVGTQTRSTVKKNFDADVFKSKYF
jgi:hypothetical protein